MRPKDRALVVSFSNETTVLAEPTSDHEALRRAIRSAKPGGSSRVYDAVNFVLNKKLADIKGKTALILFTDGVDNDSSNSSFESTLREVVYTESLIYPVQFSTYDYIKARSPSGSFKPPLGSGFSEEDYRLADHLMHNLAKISGTGVYPAIEIRDLERAIAGIVDELHNEYSIGYYPRTQGQPGDVRTVQVRVNQPQLVVRARSGYVIDKWGTVIRSHDLSIPVDRIPEYPGPPPLLRTFDTVQTEGLWICKGPNSPSDLAVVKEGFVTYCPPSKRSNDRTNAWYLQKPRPTEVICKGFMTVDGREVAAVPVPAGYAVIAETKDSACANSSNASVTANAWEIRLPRDNEVVCKGFPLPQGFVVVDERSTPSCPVSRTGRNAWVIRPRD